VKKRKNATTSTVVPSGKIIFREKIEERDLVNTTKKKELKRAVTSSKRALWRQKILSTEGKTERLIKQEIDQGGKRAWCKRPVDVQRYPRQARHPKIWDRTLEAGKRRSATVGESCQKQSTRIRKSRSRNEKGKENGWLRRYGS